MASFVQQEAELDYEEDEGWHGKRRRRRSGQGKRRRAVTDDEAEEEAVPTQGWQPEAHETTEREEAPLDHLDDGPDVQAQVEQGDEESFSAFVEHSANGLEPDLAERLLERTHAELESALRQSAVGPFLRFFGLSQASLPRTTPQELQELSVKFSLAAVRLRRVLGAARGYANATLRQQLDKLDAFIGTAIGLVIQHAKLQALRAGNAPLAGIHYLQPGRKLKPKDHLRVWLLERLGEAQLRRKDGDCYAQVRVMLCQTEDGTWLYRTYNEKLKRSEGLEHRETYLTASWDKSCTILQFTQAQAKKEQNLANWLALGMADNMFVSWLKTCSESEFPDVEPSRVVRSFLNGVLDLSFENIKFHPYGNGALPPELTACKHFDHLFDHRLVLSAGLDADYWWYAPTPWLSKLLSDQGFSVRTQAMFFVLVGRLLYALGDHDQWQIMLFLMGVGCSGKSTIGKIIGKFFLPAHVADLASNMESTFGLSALVGKLLWICQEVTNTFKLPLSDLLQIIDGSDMNVAKKHETAQTRSMRIPGLLIGNQMGPWTDIGYRLTRRLCIMEFTRMVVANPQMDKHLEAELPAILFKSQRAYERWAANSREDDFWTLVPQYFKDLREKIQTRMNPIVEFVKHSDVLEYDPSKKNEWPPLPYAEFVTQLRLWDRDCAQKAGSRADVMDVLRTMNLDVDSSSAIFGLRIRRPDEAQDAALAEARREAQRVRAQNQQYENALPAQCLHLETLTLCEDLASCTCDVDDAQQADGALGEGAQETEQARPGKQGERGLEGFEEGDQAQPASWDEEELRGFDEEQPPDEPGPPKHVEAAVPSSQEDKETEAQ